MSSATLPVSTTSAWREKKTQTSLTTGYYAAFVALGLTTGSLGPTLPGLAEHTHTHLSQISFLFTARSMGYLIGSFRGGRLYDRAPGHPVIAAMLITMALMMALVPLIPLLWLLTIILLILGAAEGALDAGGNTLLVWVHGRRVAPFLGGLHFFFGVGAFLAPVIVAQALLYGHDIMLAYWVLALPVLPLSFWLLRLPSPPAQITQRDSTERGFNYQLVVLITVFFFLYLGAEVGFGGWVFTYAMTLKLGDASRAAYLTSAFWGSLTVGRLISIPLATRLRPRTILTGDLAGCLLSIGMIGLWPNSLAVVWLGTTGLGLSMASIFPTTFSLAERRMKITGRITGWFLVGASAGAMFLPWLIGQFFESLGPRVMVFSILIDLIAAAAIFVMLLRTSRRQARPSYRKIFL